MLEDLGRSLPRRDEVIARRGLSRDRPGAAGEALLGLSGKARPESPSLTGILLAEHFGRSERMAR